MHKLKNDTKTTKDRSHLKKIKRFSRANNEKFEPTNCSEWIMQRSRIEKSNLLLADN